MRKRGATPNDNTSVTRMLARQFGRYNRGRNRILFLAVAVSILTLTVTFGISYGKVQAEYLKSVRKAGNAASVCISGVDGEQYRMIQNLGYVKQAARSVTVGEAKAEQSEKEKTEEKAERPGAADTKEKQSSAGGQDGGSVCTIQWTDLTGWEEIFCPAYTEIHGVYPERAQEIMLSVDALEAMGIVKPKEGMEIHLEVSLGLFQTADETFSLSGWFTDYAQEKDSLSAGFISREKLEEWGYHPDRESDILIRPSSRLDWRTVEEQLYEDVPMRDSGQKITAMNTSIYEAVSQLAGGYTMAVFFALLILCGMFFLVRNVIQISMIGDIRQMGLLNLIGTTEKQIRSIYYRQILRVLIPGAFTGAVLSGLFLLTILPYMLGNQYLAEYGAGKELHMFRSEILAASVLLIVLLTMAVSAGVIRHVVSMSCAESVRYTGLLKRKGKKYLRRKNGKRGKDTDGMSVSFLKKTKQNRRKGENSELAAMAWRNLTRYKSRFVLTILSLFLGMETFLAAVVITAGSDYVHVIEQRPDFLIAGEFSQWAQEEGYGKEYESRDAGEDPMLTEGNGIALLYDNDYDEFSPISSEVREQLLRLDGVDEKASYVMEGAYMLSAVSQKGIAPLLDEAYFAAAGESGESGNLDDLGDGSLIEGTTTDVIQILTAGEMERLERYVEKNQLPADMERVKDGAGVLILHDHMLSPAQEELAKDSVGEPVYFTGLLSKEDRISLNQMTPEERDSEDFNGEKSESFVLSGYLDNRAEGFPHIAQTWHGAKGSIYYLMSEKGFEKLPTEKKTLYMELQVDSEKEPQIKSKIQQIVREENSRRSQIRGTGISEETGESGIFCISKSDLQAKAASDIRGSRLLLGCISMALLFAGLTNYFNVVITGLLARKKEMEILAKIGMTHKQRNKMLFFEGGYYCLILSGLILTVGSAALCLVRLYMEEKLSYFVLSYPVGWTIALLACLAAVCAAAERICSGCSFI